MFILLQSVAFVHLLIYAVFVSQSFSYIISLSNVQQNMGAEEYILFRKQTDINFRKKYKLVIYGTLVAGILQIIIAIINSNYMILVSGVAATMALFVDIKIALKGNIPINDIINTWTTDKYPIDWEQYRSKWFYYYNKRKVLSIAGFIFLTAGIVFS